MNVAYASPPCVFTTPIGAPIFAIDDYQNVVRGTYVRRESAYVVLEINFGGVRRRRRFHARFVHRDWSPS